MSSNKKIFFISILVSFLYFVTLYTTLSEIGPTDDIDYYMKAAIRYSEWIQKTIAKMTKGDLTGFSRSEIDSYWRENHEHPPFAKLIMGMSHLIFTKWLKVTDNIDGIRLGIILLVSTLGFTLCYITYRYVGAIAAVGGSLMLLFMPRFFFHSHVETLDAAVASTFFFSFSAYMLSRRSLRWSILCGLIFGISLATKLNAPFFYAGILAYWGVKNIDEFKYIKGEGIRFPRVELSLITMPLLGVLVFYLIWPWLWNDTLKRLNDYLSFHLKHYGIYFYYFGTIYEKPFAPWHSPFIMTLITTPPLTILLAIAGTIVILFTLLKSYKNIISMDKEKQVFYELLLLNAFVTIGTVAFPNVPKYGGVKLFLPFFPFLAIIAGVGLEAASEFIKRKLRIIETLSMPYKEENHRSGASVIKNSNLIKSLITIALILGSIVPAVYSTLKIHPYHLSYYNIFIGGLQGALNAGMERQYYDIFYIELANWFNKNLPQDAKITFLPNNKEYIRSAPYLKRDKRLRDDIKIVDISSADYLVLTHEERWREYPRLYSKYNKLPSLFEIKVEGVPLLNVYKLK